MATVDDAFEQILSMRQMNELIAQFFSEDSRDTAEVINSQYTRLKEQRLDDDLRDFDYATPLTDSEADEREVFFSNLVLLVDRHEDDATRLAVLSYVAEMVAVEKDRYAGPRGSSDVGGMGYGFGREALMMLRDIMSAVVGIREPFVQMVQDVLVDVLDQMQPMYFIALLPVLIDVVSDPKLGYDVAREFEEVAEQMADVFKYTLILMSGKVLNTENKDEVVVNLPKNLPGANGRGGGGGGSSLGGGSSDDDSDEDGGGGGGGRETRPVNVPMLPRAAFFYVCELMSVCAQSEYTADEFHRYKVSSLLSVEKTRYMRTKDTPDDLNGESAVHKLMGAMARHSAIAADAFAYPDVVDAPGKSRVSGRQRPYILESLVREVRQIDDKGVARGRGGAGAGAGGGASSGAADALTLLCLNGILRRSEKACRWMSDTAEVNANTYIENLIRIAKNAEKGPLIAAAMDGLLTIVDQPLLARFKVTMEQECDIASKLQDVIRNLFTTTKAWGEPERQAVIAALNMMRVYSEVPEISAQLNESDYEGYDRESIIFRLLNSREDSVTDDVKLAAAETLRVVPLVEFDKKEIRAVVNMLSSVPALVSAKTYDIMSNLVFLMFKMAMDGDEVADAAADDRQSCGPAFRDIYATEVVSALFGNIARAMEGDLANAASPIEPRKRLFETACVKFLMTGWKQVQLRSGLDTEPIRETLVKVLVTEQTILQHASDHRFQNHQHLFLEQSYVGFDVRNILTCLRALRQPDVVAFRCFFQLADVLAGRQREDLLDELNRAADRGFDMWHRRIKCGREVPDMARLESEYWRRPSVLLPPFPILEADVAHSKSIADVQAMHCSFYYKLRKESAHKKWKRQVEDGLRLPDQVVHLAMVERADDGVSPAEHRVVAFCGGGPFRKAPIGEYAELYSLGFDPRYASHRQSIEASTIARLSHELFLRGYKYCLAFVRVEDRNAFDSTPGCDWLNAPGGTRPKWQRAMAELKIRIDEDDENKRVLLYGWELEHNLWVDQTAHARFLQDDGIRMLVNFLNKDAGETLAEYSPAALDRTLNIGIRQVMEEFGSELMKKLEQNQHGGGGGGGGGGRSDDEDRDGDERYGDSDGRSRELRRLAADEDGVDKADPSRFAAHVEGQFKRPAASILSRALEPPQWDSQLTGTEEENFLQTLTLSLDALGGRTKELHAAQNRKQRRKKRRRKAAQREAAQRDAEEDMLRYKGDQNRAACAAMFRAIFVLVHGANYNLRRKALSTVRDPLVFHSIHHIVRRVNYGLRETVSDPLNDEYGIGIKFMHLIELLVKMEPRGLRESLLAVELYEVVVQVLDEVLGRVVALLASRNTTTDDPLHRTRALHAYEEKLLARVCRTAAVLINQVSSIQFFEGSVEVAMIYEGNAMCRLHALRQLFARSNALRTALPRLLLYDLELDTGLHEESHAVEALMGSAAGAVGGGAAAGAASLAGGGLAAGAPGSGCPPEMGGAKPAGYHRDVMKTHILEILGQLCSFDDAFRYQFVREYARGLAQAELGLRASFVQEVLNISKARQLRARIEAGMREYGVLKRDGEAVVEHAFVSHGDSSESGVKLLVLSTHNYYLSRAVMAPDAPTDDIGAFMDLERLGYRSVKRLYRGFGDQMFAVLASVPSSQADGGVAQTRLDVFMERRLGVAERLLETFSHFCLDDLSQEKRVHEDTFTERALIQIYAKVKLERLPTNFSTHWRPQTRCMLYTFAYVMQGGVAVPRVLVWAQNVSTNLLLVLRCSMGRWKALGAAYGSKIADDDGSLAGYFSLEQTVKLDDLESVEFTETPRAIMVLGFKRVTLTVLFKGDISREQWRRHLKEYLQVKNDWSSSVLPDLHDQDRHTRKLI